MRVILALTENRVNYKIIPNGFIYLIAMLSLKVIYLSFLPGSARIAFVLNFGKFLKNILC